MLVRPEKSSHHLAIAISILCGSDRAETIPRTDISIRHAECGRPAFHEHVSEDRNTIAAAGLMKAVPMSLTDSDGRARQTVAERSTAQIKGTTVNAVKTRLHLSPFFRSAKSNPTQQNPAEPPR